MSDLISRQDAIDLLSCFTQTDTLGNTPLQIVENLPSAQPECKTGRWLKDGEIDDVLFYRCSECGSSEPIRGYKFCPNCGADMRGDQDE